jgi:DNA-3-methyladenine glycosylase I
MNAPLLHPDGLRRCPWAQRDPLYVAYHDTEWGVPEFDDRAFDGFAPEKIARYTPKKIDRLMQDAGIVRNRMKIEGAVLSARAYLDIMEREEGFARLLWDFLDGRPKVNAFRSTKQVPAETALSRQISKELKRRGFKFCGPTIVYAFMQAVGMVNDHLVSCHRHAALRQPHARP